MSTSFCFGSFWKSSTDPREDRDVDEAEAVGESSGVPAVELDTVEGIEIPADQNSTTEYPIAALTGSQNADLAKAFGGPCGGELQATAMALMNVLAVLDHCQRGFA